jgi:hypothetical protein
MVNPPTETEAFAELVEALRPWLPVVVFAGGWAHRLYRRHPLANAPSYPPLMTKDTDVALDPLSVPSTQSIRDRLVAGGFVEDFAGDDRPPVTYYRFREQSSTNFAEFLVPLTGGWETRAGRPSVTMKVGGVNAQKLRFLEILLLAPWTITLPGPKSGYPEKGTEAVPLRQSATLRLPNPTGYLAQKVLIHGYRTRSQRAKDMLYVHDTLEIFADALPTLRTIWGESLKRTLHERQVRRIEGVAEQLRRNASDEATEASLQARAVGRDIPPDRLVDICAYGLREIFGS